MTHDECYCDFPSREFFGCFDRSHVPPCPQAYNNMTPKQYAAAIEALGLSQRAAGVFLGVDERTSRRWVLGESAIPESVAKLLRLMVRLKISPDDVK
jgi:DNA-binding transcriptional regulator YiaG